MSERYYVDSVPEGIQVGGQLALNAEETRHLTKVMRKKVGESVTVFDGRGGEFETRIVAIQKDRTDLEITAILPPEPAPSIRLTLAVSLPKGERQKVLVEKLTELGVARIVPMVTQYSVAKVDAQTVERLRRQSIEAAKQCGRRRLPEITEVRSMQEIGREFAHKIFGHPPRDGDVGQRKLIEWAKLGTIDEMAVAIGPEGGFSPEEVEAALAEGWIPISLGAHTLRTETAAMAAAATLSILFL